MDDTASNLDDDNEHFASQPALARRPNLAAASASGSHLMITSGFANDGKKERERH